MTQLSIADQHGHASDQRMDLIHLVRTQISSRRDMHARSLCDAAWECPPSWGRATDTRDKESLLTIFDPKVEADESPGSRSTSRGKEAIHGPRMLRGALGHLPWGEAERLLWLARSNDVSLGGVGPRVRWFGGLDPV
ncbi:hypothetical protein CRG98_032895 [Punica granatum]|uniref:Uncharacterized protein n=1 Tax=Punica granatum TaxID=22663 RepID=A0A2I0IRV2_PUNGR|nr:hypothetical protein CRG98_032895 [Punica granatum]